VGGEGRVGQKKGEVEVERKREVEKLRSCENEENPCVSAARRTVVPKARTQR
jgi:hypothetical protein